ncbi:MAG: hypothetical protein GY814_08610, partial [Gammaproteobacteria bacterium]|nr:hypothetical protein [Gammaproteobacteria bacterium]
GLSPIVTTLTLIVMGTIPLYVILSVVVTPILRARLDKKFEYGAVNQAFLTESITGVVIGCMWVLD